MKKKKRDDYVSFENSQYSPKKRLNPHINFDLEGSKSNARKVATEVTCSECKVRFTLPFKPRKPDVYCDSCFKKIKNKH